MKFNFKDSFQGHELKCSIALQEMWALFDFVTEGQLLGTSRTFKKEFADPIVRVKELDQP